MKHFKILALMALALFGGINAANAQEISTQGKEFWLSFIGNGFKYHPNNPNGWVRVQLMVSAQRSCTGVITNPNTGWSQSFSVEANNIFSVDLEETQVYVESSEYEQVVNKGLQISTTDTVSVYCANIATYSFDASYVLPTEGLADDYIIQTFDQSSYTSTYDPTSAFVIVATEDNTTIDITPSVKTFGGKPAHQKFSIVLNKGQAYQLRSSDSNSNRDLSGTRVTAHDCKKIAIFNGNNLTLIPVSASSDCDCVFEQAMPLRSWGGQFVVTTSLGRSQDYYKITSSADGNVIRKNGEVLFTLNANESRSISISSSEKSCYLEATHSCAVYLYNTSSNGSGNGAPSMVWIAPIEQRIDEITFSTFNYDHSNVNISNHYMNIIVESQDVDKVYLDNALLPSGQFDAVAGNSDYSYYRAQITHGVHHLSCPNGFNAHIYGFGDARGYAYMVGSKTADLSTTLIVNGETVAPNDTIMNCFLEPLTFAAEINLSNYELLWDFGDGTTSTDNPATHTYESYAFYEATLTVRTQENPCGGGSTSGITSKLYITSNLEDIEPVSATDCDAYTWDFNGQTYFVAGAYADTLPDPTTGCYQIGHLDLDLEYTPDPTPIYPKDTINTAPHWVITATEFQIMSYDFYLWDYNTACHWDSVTWAFENTGIGWLLVPDENAHPKGIVCKMYVLEHVNDTIWLDAKVYNKCHPEGIVRRYWFVSSFFGTEENNEEPALFSVAPNPNNGQMTLHFEHLTGTIDMKVYDMRGTIIDHFQIYNSQGSLTCPYEMKDLSDGIYLFVATGKEGTLCKKTITIH